MQQIFKNELWPYLGVSNFGGQFPIPTRYKISVWGDQSPRPRVVVASHDSR